MHFDTATTMAQIVERLSSHPIVTHAVVYDTHVVYYAQQSGNSRFIECARAEFKTDAVRKTQFVTTRNAFVRVEDGELAAYNKKRLERVVAVRGVQKILVAFDLSVLVLDVSNRVALLTLANNTAMLKSTTPMHFVIGTIVSAAFITPTKIATLDDSAVLAIYSTKERIADVTLPGIPTHIAGACNGSIYCVVIDSLSRYLANPRAYVYTVDQTNVVAKTDTELQQATPIAVVGSSLLYVNERGYWAYAGSPSFANIKPTLALPTQHGVFITLDNKLNAPI